MKSEEVFLMSRELFRPGFFSLDNVEIVIGTSGKRIKADDITKEKIYDQNGGALWADDEENGMIGLYRAILSVDDFKPIGYMIIECKNSYFSEKLQSVPSTYKNRFLPFE